MAFESGQKETPVPVCRKRPRKGIRGERAKGYPTPGGITSAKIHFRDCPGLDPQSDFAQQTRRASVARHAISRRVFLFQEGRFSMKFEKPALTIAEMGFIAGYHQFHAVNAAVEETVRASGMGRPGQAGEEPGTYWSGRMHGGKPGDRRAGVVWHTQGSGKSFSMLFYAARIVRHPAMENPTLVVLTDRNDLDDQPFGQFQRCHEILGQIPIQAASREHLRELLNTRPTFRSRRSRPSSTRPNCCARIGCEAGPIGRPTSAASHCPRSASTGQGMPGGSGTGSAPT